MRKKTVFTVMAVALVASPLAAVADEVADIREPLVKAIEEREKANLEAKKRMTLQQRISEMRQEYMEKVAPQDWWSKLPEEERAGLTSGFAERYEARKDMLREKLPR